MLLNCRPKGHDINPDALGKNPFDFFSIMWKIQVNPKNGETKETKTLQASTLPPEDLLGIATNERIQVSSGELFYQRLSRGTVLCHNGCHGHHGQAPIVDPYHDKLPLSKKGEREALSFNDIMVA